MKRLVIKILIICLIPLRIFIPMVIDIVELNFFPENFNVVPGRAEKYRPKRKNSQISKDLLVSYNYNGSLDSLILDNVRTPVKIGDTLDVFVSKKNGIARCKENNSLTILALLLFFIPVVCYIVFIAIDVLFDKANLS